jgi:hypothetical protein
MFFFLNYDLNINTALKWDVFMMLWSHVLHIFPGLWKCELRYRHFHVVSRRKSTISILHVVGSMNFNFVHVIFMAGLLRET